MRAGMRAGRITSVALTGALIMSVSAFAEDAIVINLEPEAEQAGAVNKEAALEAMVAYGSILDNVSLLDSEHTVNEYDEYALVYMEDTEIPQMLVTLYDPTVFIGDVSIVEWNADTRSASKISVSEDDEISVGVAGGGGFRGSVSASQTRDGLIHTVVSGGTGDTSVERVRIVNGAYEYTTEYTGMLTDAEVNRPDEASIAWFPISDRSLLDQFPSTGKDSTQVEAPAEGDASTQDGATTDTATDTTATAGADSWRQEQEAQGRQVFEGTIRTMSYNEVLQLQNISDPNAGWSDTSQMFTLFIFNGTQTLTADTADGSGLMSGEAHMIRLANVDVSAYEGQTVTASFAASNMSWPSDTSLPLGEPAAWDIVVYAN